MTPTPILRDPTFGTHEAAAESYERSDEFRSNAVDWVGTARELPADLMDAICAAYRCSDAFDGVVGDALDGEVAW